jgi:membrane protease YdiL (CAAX protease family)
MADPVVVVILWLAVAGVVQAIVAPVGIAIDALILLALARWSREGGRTAVVAGALMLVPLLRLLWAGLAIDGVSPLDASPTIGLTFLAATWLTARAIGIDRRQIGLVMPDSLALQFAVVVLLGGLGVAGAIVFGPLGGVDPYGAPWRLVVYAIILAAAEEIAFRGVLPVALAEGDARRGWALAVTITVIVSLGAAPPLVAAALILSSVISAIAVQSTGQLSGVLVGRILFLIAWGAGPALAERLAG